MRNTLDAVKNRLSSALKSDSENGRGGRGGSSSSSSSSWWGRNRLASNLSGLGRGGSRQQADETMGGGSGGRKNPALCEWCAAVDFELFRLPTEADLREAAAGRLPNRPPYHFPVEGFNGHVVWSLGPLSRVVESSSSAKAAGEGAAPCPLCAAVRHFCVDRADVRAMLQLDSAALWADSPGGDPHCKLTLISAAGRFDAGRPCSIFTAGIAVSGPPSRPELLGPGRLTSPDSGWRRHAMDCFRVGEEQQQARPPPGKKGPSAASSLSRSRFGARPRPARADMDMLSRWLRSCLDSHGDTCGDAMLQDRVRAPLIRLIDVEARCVVELHGSEAARTPYAALSYVWGAKQRLVMLNRNRAELLTPGALGPDGTARTISDAIALTGRLGVRHLWVDALCIIQDDLPDKALQIGNMSNIYADALFTIIAACGTDSEAGLAGLWDDRPAAERHEVPVLLPPGAGGDDDQDQEDPPDGSSPPSRAMTLVAMTKPRTNTFDHVLADTRWHTRGWTMQERALSRRVLMFTDWEVYWSCGALSLTEESGSDAADLQPRLSLFALDEAGYELMSRRRAFFAHDDPEDQAWYKLKHMATDFSRRQLTVEGDAYDAFSSILTQFTAMTGEHFLWALPASRFAQGLCWEPVSRPVRRRRCRTTLEQTSLRRHVPFPSWSWLGWDGQITPRIEPSLVDEGVLDPELVCYVLRNTPLRLVPVSRLAADNAASSSQSSSSTAPLTSPNALKIEDVLSSHPGLSHALLADTPDDQLIVFRAEVATLRITKPIAEPSGVSFRRDVLGERSDPRDASSPRKVVGAIPRCFGEGEAHGLEDDDGDDDEERLALLVRVAALTDPVGEVPLTLSVLLVRDDGRGRGVLERVGIGEVREAEWTAAKPETRIVVMG